jgi:hypothetical protein
MSPKTFCSILGRISDPIRVNAFAKLYFTGIGPFRLMRHPAMISLPFLRLNVRGERDERFFKVLSFR